MTGVQTCALPIYPEHSPDVSAAVKHASAVSTNSFWHSFTTLKPRRARCSSTAGGSLLREIVDLKHAQSARAGNPVSRGNNANRWRSLVPDVVDVSDKKLVHHERRCMMLYFKLLDMEKKVCV